MEIILKNRYIQARDICPGYSGDAPLDGYLDIVLLGLISSPRQSATHFASHPASQPANHATPLP